VISDGLAENAKTERKWADQFLEATMKKFQWLAILFTVLLGAGITQDALAQSTNSGDISGIVTDSTGATVPGATVTVLNIATGVSKEFVTNDAGVYDTSSIVAGTYKLTFQKAGFSTLVRSSITVIVGPTTVNAQLSVGGVSQEVVVSTDIPLLKTENGEQSTTLSAETLAALPEVGQDWTRFNILLPGASGATGGAQGVLAQGGSTAPGITVAVNGNLPFSTVLADGAETTLPASANADIFTQETIQELQVSTSAFSAQYGVGGILYNQISKGGTDRFHGAAYEYFQNEALNALPYAFSGPTSKYFRYNNFGGSIGGPILKDKLFFYFNIDKIISHGSTSAASFTVPTTAVMAGDFTGFNTIYDPATQITQQTGTYLYPGQTTPTTCPCVIRQSFADEYHNGNKIPSSRFDPVAVATQAYWAKPNTAGTLSSNGLLQNNYTYTAPQSSPFIRYFGRLDYQVKSNNHIVMSVNDGDNPGQGFGAGICPINCQSQDVSKVNAQISDVWSFGPRVTNEVRIGYTNQLNFFSPLSAGLGYPGKIGLKFAKADTFPTFNFASGTYSGMLSPQSNAVYKEHVYNPSDVVTMVVGRHILHFGGELLIYQNNSTAWGNTDAGSFTFTGQYTQAGPAATSTGFTYADFLLGQTQKWTASVTPEFGGRQKLPQFFVQDDYKIRPNLTLNLGLRYQIQTGWSEVKGNERSFDPTVQNPGTGTPGALWYGSTKANGRGRIQDSVYSTFLPRFGFAYQLDPNTVIRGGFGLYAYNWSNDTYNGGVMGAAFGSQGNVTDSTNGVTPVVILSGSGSNLPYIAASTDPTALNGAGNNLNYAQFHQPVGGSYQWNVQAQRQLNSNIVASLAYVGTHGHDLPFPVDVNQVPQGKLAVVDQQFRPYPQYGSLNVSGTAPNENAISNYNSLQAVIEQRMKHGLDYQFSYVWSHFLDDMDTSGWGSRAGNQGWQNAYNPQANYGNSNFDVRNAFKGRALYQLPFGQGKQFLNNNRALDVVLGGWQLSTLMVIQSGQPFTPVMGNGTASYASGGGGFAWYPNVIGSPNLANRGIKQWFNEAAFAVPTSGTFGNERRGQLTGPGLNTWSLSLGKTFAIWEDVRLQVRADADNIWNHPNFALPNANLSLTGSTVSTGTSNISNTSTSMRNMQLSARITF
jgi:Carboxypeptidase regulatory-like domain/TonB dependent receptor